MSETTKVKITQVGKKQQPSKFKPGETYTIATIMDEITGRKASAFGGWTDNWKVGDEVDVIWKEHNWTDKDGFEQKGWNLENPNKKEYTGPKGGYGAAAAKPSIVDAYAIAAVLTPVLYATKKTIKFEDVVKIADALKAKFDEDVPAPAPTAAATPVVEAVKNIDVDTEKVPTSKAADITEVADDNEDPF